MSNIKRNVFLDGMMLARFPVVVVPLYIRNQVISNYVNKHGWPVSPTIQLFRNLANKAIGIHLRQQGVAANTLVNMKHSTPSTSRRSRGK